MDSPSSSGEGTGKSIKSTLTMRTKGTLGKSIYVGFDGGEDTETLIERSRETPRNR